MQLNKYKQRRLYQTYRRCYQGIALLLRRTARRLRFNDPSQGKRSPAPSSASPLASEGGLAPLVKAHLTSEDL
ncbi:hypothetical protein ACSBR1_043804 [Camellia fascicularis]